MSDTIPIERFNPNGLYLERVGDVDECKKLFFKKEINKIGRKSSMDIFFDTRKASTVSREHSVISFRNGKMFISNLSKTNPTFINSDKVVSPTEVEEGDLIGFGSKPKCVYPDFKPDEIFIYECRSIYAKDIEQKSMDLQPCTIVNLVDSDDDVEVVEHNNPTSPKDVIPIESSSRPTQKILQDSQPAPKRPQIVKPSPKTLQDPKPASIYIDTVEKLKDSEDSSNDGNLIHEISISSDESLHEVENPKYQIKGLKIILSKLTDADLEQWRLNKRKDSRESEKAIPIANIPSTKSDEPEGNKKACGQICKIAEKDSIDQNSKLESNKTEKKKKLRFRLRSIADVTDDEETMIKLHSQKEKLLKSKETLKKLRKVVDSDSEDETSGKKIPFPQMSTANSSKPNDSKKDESRSIEKSRMPKRKASIMVEKDQPNKKLKTTAEETSTKSIQKVSSIFELKSNSIEIDSKKPSSTNNIIKRRMSLGPIARKPPARRKTICEIDMFSVASKLRLSKFGPEMVNNSNNNNNNNNNSNINKPKELTKQPEVESIKLRNRPEPPKVAPKPDVTRTNESKKDEAGSYSKVDIQKKASQIKIKLTSTNRGFHLTEAISSPPVIARRMSMCNDPSTSKDALSISAFREKYVRPNVATSSSITNNNNSGLNSTEKAAVAEDLNLDSINLRINMEMQKQHQQLAVESTNVEEPDSEHSSPLSNQEDFPESDLDEGNSPIGFYNSLSESPKESFNLSDSPMKDDPRGKTKWVSKDKENQTSEEKVALELFPETPTYTPTIYVKHDVIPKSVKSILSKNFSSSKGNHKKMVSFNEYQLVDIRYVPYLSECANTNQQIAHVSPIKQLTKHPKDFEITACDEILEWNAEWLKLDNDLPENWRLEPIKCRYSSLDEYKNAIRTFMNANLLRKLSMKYKAVRHKSNPWNFVTVKERKNYSNHHMKLILGCDAKDIRQGCMLLMKFRDNRYGNSTDIAFFGYVSAVNERGELRVNSYCRELQHDKAVLKAICLTSIRYDLRFFSILNCLQETPLMKLFLDPSLNKIDRKEEMSSISVESEGVLKLNLEQRSVIRKLWYESSKDDSEKIFFINGGAGTGKTYLIIAAIMNLKYHLKEKRRFLVCTSTLTGIDVIADTISNVPYSKSLNIVRVGYKENYHKYSGKKLFINDQVQARMSRGAPGSYRDIYKEIIEDADIILTTCHGCYELFDCDVQYDTCFIDEANFCLDAEILIPIMLNVKKLILVGDEYQLQRQQSPNRSNISYFSRMIDYYKGQNLLNAPVFTLTTQQRMSKALYEICNK